MLTRALNLVKFFLERWLLQGTAAQLVVIAGMLGLVSLGGGLSLYAFDPGEGMEGSVWWAFLRLSDPGYLGDDQGTARRIISTLLTVAGYVLFMGSLVAIMTAWLNRKMRDLESGFTPIALRGHVVVIGWTNRTAVIARELFASVVRVRRLLLRYDARTLRLVFLLEHLDAGIRAALRQRVGPSWRERNVTMRSGSALQLEDLTRVDVAHAAAILVPSEDFGASEGAADARTVKTLASLRHHLAETGTERLPLVVSELFDAQKRSLARRLYPGPVELICSDQLVGRLLALTVLYPGLTAVLDELLTFAEGNEVHIVDAPGLVGKTVDDIRACLPESLCVGFVGPDGRSFRPRLGRLAGEALAADDRLVVIANDPEAAVPAVSSGVTPSPLPTPADGDDESGSITSSRPSAPLERVLVVGWSDRVPDLLHELHAHHGGHLMIEVFSAVAIERREAELGEHSDTEVVVHHTVGDATRRGAVAKCLGAQRFDRIVLVASDWLATGAQSDARTLLTYLLFRDELRRLRRDTPMVVELMERANRPLIRHRHTEALVSAQVIGRVLAQVTMRRELRAVYDGLFDTNGPALGLRTPADYGLRSASGHDFASAGQVIAARGDLLLGWLGADRAPRLNPPRDAPLDLAEGTRLVVLAPPAAKR
ncbi:MAG: hypothetical protein AAF715_26625 [Myxococcota bacterium]